MAPHLGNKTYAPQKGFFGAAAAAAAAGAAVWLVTLTKARPTYKNSQQSHPFSPFFTELSLEVGFQRKQNDIKIPRFNKYHVLHICSKTFLEKKIQISVANTCAASRA